MKAKTKKWVVFAVILGIGYFFMSKVGGGAPVEKTRALAWAATTSNPTKYLSLINSFNADELKKFDQILTAWNTQVDPFTLQFSDGSNMGDWWVAKSV